MSLIHSHAARMRKKLLVGQLLLKSVCIILIISILTVSTPAAPATMVNIIGRASQDARFAFLSSRLAIDGPKWFAAFLSPRRSSAPPEDLHRIQIFPDPVTVREGSSAVFAAVGFDSQDEPLIGIPFVWELTDTENRFPKRRMLDSIFKADLPGTFTVSATSDGHSDEITVTVVPIEPEELARINSKAASPRQISSRSTKTIKNADNGNSPTLNIANLLPGEGWDDTNWQSADNPGNQTGNPPGGPADDGAGNGNFQLSAPVVSLPGRGIDLALNLNYNSRVWNKSGNNVTYDIDYGIPAAGWSLGFGKIVHMGSGGCMMIDADGTRHGYSGSVSSWGTGMSFTGHTADGKFIDYGCQFTYGQNGSGWAKLPNGTDIIYSTAAAGNAHVYPTRITDAQGNYITITYKNLANPGIETITDTTGRVITFQYDAQERLISVKGPRMKNEDPIYGDGKTRILLQIHYRALALNYSFAPGTNAIVRNGTPWAIDSIYYPGTQTGYWFGGADASDQDYASYYSSYGMLAKVEEHRGMNWTTGAEEQGTIVKGQMTKRALYNYPLTTANETGRTNGTNLTDAPTYTTLKESWDGADVADPAITSYSINENDWHHDGTSNSPSRTITVTQPSGAISKQYSYRTPGAWTDGLVFADETIVMNGSVPVTIGSSLVSWQQGQQPEYFSPRPSWAEVTDENGHKVKTVYEYTSGKFNQITRSCDYDNGNNKLRCAAAQYENGQNYIGYFDTAGKYVAGRHIFNLVLASTVENPDGSVASRTEYEYDNYQNNALVNAPGVIQHKASHNPFDTGTHLCNCGWSCDRARGGGLLPDNCPDGYPPDWVCDLCPNFDTSTNYRGNITKVTSYSDANAAAGAVYETRGYDITGNLVKASSSCCEQTSMEYSLATQYAYPVSQTRGAADAASPHRITTNSTYDQATGLVKTVTDANGLTSTNWYNPNTLRPVKSVSSTGAYSTFGYDDAAMSVTEEAREASGNLAGKTIKYLNGLGQVRKEESYGPGIVDIAETKYTKFGEEWKQSRPFRSGDTIQWSERFYDAQRRLIKVVEPDGSETKAFYNETTLPDSVTSAPGNRIRVMDAWGRERWGRYDQQGRLQQVVEPNPDAAANPTGSVFAAGSLLTKYTHDTLGRLTQTEQGVQFRKFKYDDLGRLMRQKLAEQAATLNDSGQYVGVNQPGANWSEAFWFDNRSNLTMKIDPRGVKTHLSYQIAGAEDPLNRIQSRIYDMSGPLDPGLTIHAAPGVTYEYMTAGDKSRIRKIRTDGLLTEDFTYDVESRVSEYKQTVDYRTSYPMTLNYLYDTLDRVKEVTYPAQYGIAGDPRKIVANTYDTASRLTSLTYGGVQQAGNIDYNAADQTTSINIGTAGTNQVNEQYTFDPQTGLLTNQKAVRGGTNLLDLSYEYNRNNSVGSLNGKTGHLTKIVNNLDNNKNREYEFDVLGRLTRAKGGPTGNLSQQNYTYDRYGNRTNVTASGVAADNTTMPTDGIPNLAFDNTSNRITSMGFQYDSAGNQTRALAEDGVTWVKYEYDAANRIRVVKKDDVPQTPMQSFQYGSTNARVMAYDHASNLWTFYASNGGTTLAEYIEYASLVFTWTKSYTYLGGSQLATITPNGGGGEYTEYNHPDRLGTRVITNQQTGTSYEQAHLPFGRPLDAESSLTSNNKRFTSYDRSAPTGLDYAVNRTYDSKQGRFTQVDPIGMGSVGLAAPQTLNLYAYCTNDPVNHTDPSGLFWGFFKKLFKWIAKALKWIAIVVAVAFVVISSIWAPGSTGFVAKLMLGMLDFLSKIGGALSFASGGLIAATEIATWQIGLLAIAGMGVGAAFAEKSLNKPKRTGKRFPCPPTFARMVGQFGRLLIDLFENQSGHQTNSPLENGGWIYQRKNGKLFFVRADNAAKLGGSAERYRDAMNLQNPAKINGARVVGKAHTHPYTPYEQGLISSKQRYGGPSTDDFLNSAKESMPSIVVHQTGVVDGRREITIAIANPGVHAIPDRNCSRR